MTDPSSSAPEELTSPIPAAVPATSASQETVRGELLRLLSESTGQIANVAALVIEGVSDRSVMVERGAAANNGAVGNLLLDIRAICDGDLPTGPNNAELG